MAYREVHVNQALRPWLLGAPRKRLAAALGLDPKPVRRYLRIPPIVITQIAPS